MKNIQDYLSQLSPRDKILLVFSLFLLGSILYKFLLLDALSDSNKKLHSQLHYIAQQESIFTNVKTSNLDSNKLIKPSNIAINTFLQNSGSTGKIKQMRTTAKDQQRIEIENIKFEELTDLLHNLKNNGSQISALQIIKQDEGVTNTTITVAK